jgi:AraC-like DNA-binding protein
MSTPSLKKLFQIIKINSITLILVKTSLFLISTKYHVMLNIYESYFGGMRSNIYLPHQSIQPFIINYNFHENPRVPEEIELHPIPIAFVVLNIGFNGSSIILSKDGIAKKMDNFIAGMHGFKTQGKLRVLPYNTQYKALTITFTLPGIINLISVKINELTNVFVSLEELWGVQGKELEYRLTSTDDDLLKVKMLDSFFINKYNNLKNIQSKITGDIFILTQRKSANLSVDTIARTLNISYRTLHRIFQNDIGLCPKEYLKIIRFNKVCKYLKNYPSVGIMDIIHETGYYDQSHFIHEFKEIMKITPQEFLNECRGKFYFNNRAFRISEP